ncbi:bifunctional riboflavin kinase/FAD synthetase [Novosphingobium sp. 9]|uniref:bifunctional riboflavin kinase/FAD synthetase n=1 Tax=Novosphingobium sp. 9 TaxID=2025349 RepID=UPI0021B570FA|nr:bifunctional riboflavin kinase/FAD synthetase [Novosphingobium sp. 9]
MIRLDNRQPVSHALHGAVLALGNFDGFHAGHQAVVGEAVRWARELGRPAIVATFDPHPVRLFKPETPPFRLTTLEQRQDMFLAAGATAMLVLHFDRAMAGMGAEEWVRELLGKQLGAVGVVTGEDFTFGRGRTGSPALLQSVGAEFGLSARTVGPVRDEEGVISSSRVRHALQLGDCQTAMRLLTRPFAVRGVVQHGAKLGRSIGFPTANLEMERYLRPRYGIYAVKGRLPDGRVLPGAANLGIRPTIEPPIELLEPYFFDFSGDLYGQEIEVEFHHFLRPEAKFDSLDALMAQIGRDCEQARDLLGVTRPVSGF